MASAILSLMGRDLEALGDDELMALLSSGNRMAFGILFERYSPQVFGLVLRIFGGNRSRAEDITQEVWLKVARKAQTYQREGKFKSWVMTIARNTALDEIDKNQIHYQNVPEQEVEFLLGSVEGDQLVEKAEVEAIQKAMDSLSEPQRVVLSLWAEGELSYEEIAKALGSSVAATKSLLYRARQALAKELGVKYG